MTEFTTTRFRKRKLMVFLLALSVLALLLWYANTFLSLEQLVAQENQVRQFIADEPLRAFLIAFLVYVVLTLVPGTGGKAVVCGWLFGFWQAIVIVSIGLTIGAMTIFWLSRYLIRDVIERHYTNLVAIMNRHIEQEGVFYLLTLRMAHAPYSIVNPVSGASRVSSWTFFWTTALGLLPANAIWIYVGLSLPSLGELSARGPAAFIDAPLIAALIICGLLPVLLRWGLRILRPYQPVLGEDSEEKSTG